MQFAVLRDRDFDVEHFVSKVQQFQGDQYTVHYRQRRQLIQIQSRTSSQVHADIWLWGVNQGRVHNDDYTNAAKSRLLADVIPVQRYAWMGHNATIPHRADDILDAEYGASWGTPSVTRYAFLEGPPAMFSTQLVPVKV